MNEAQLVESLNDHSPKPNNLIDVLQANCKMKKNSPFKEQGARFCVLSTISRILLVY